MAHAITSLYWLHYITNTYIYEFQLKMADAYIKREIDKTRTKLNI